MKVAIFLRFLSLYSKKSQKNDKKIDVFNMECMVLNSLILSVCQISKIQP